MKTPKYGRSQLEIGKKYETFVQGLVGRWGLMFWVNELPAFQMKGESLQGCEIKEDKGCQKYGHLSIEIAEKSHYDNPDWVASGIFKADNSWAYIQGNYDIVFVFSKKWLLRYYEAKNPPIHEASLHRGDPPTVRKFHLPDHDDGLKLAMAGAVFVLDGNGKRLDQ